METVYVYADVVILVSVAVSYPLLRITARENSLCFRRARAFLASVISGAMLIAEVLIRLPYCCSFLWGIAAYSIMIPVSFGRMKAKRFLFTLLFFTGSNLILSGILSAVYGGGYQCFPGVLSGVIMIAVFKRIILHNGSHRKYYRLKLSFDGRIRTLEAFLDTGNLLKEPLSECPVIIVNKKYGCEGNKENRVPVYAGTAAGKTLLYAEKAEEAWIYDGREWQTLGDVMIGFSETSEFDAIIGPDAVPLCVERSSRLSDKL